MKIHLLSDLHIEFSDYQLSIQDADVLVLAGDIGNGLNGLKYAAKYKKYYKHILYIPGNHEFYNEHLSKLSIELSNVSKDLGITLLDNSSVDIDGIDFIGSTLWTDFRLYGDKLEQIGYYMNLAKANLNDFAHIRYANFWFHPSHCATLSVAAQKYIENMLKNNTDKTKVVITHHCPSKKSIHPKYLGNPINPCFANDLDTLVSKSNYWFHGHTHSSFDYEIDNCRVVCNPRGYSKYQDKQENIEFNPNLIIEVLK
jgi:predicted phosphodiesterase